MFTTYLDRLIAGIHVDPTTTITTGATTVSVEWSDQSHSIILIDYPDSGRFSLTLKTDGVVAYSASADTLAEAVGEVLADLGAEPGRWLPEYGEAVYRAFAALCHSTSWLTLEGGRP